MNNKLILITMAIIFSSTCYADPNLSDKENFEKGAQLHERGKYQDAYDLYYKDMSPTTKNTKWLTTYCKKYNINTDSALSIKDNKEEFPSTSTKIVASSNDDTKPNLNKEGPYTFIGLGFGVGAFDGLQTISDMKDMNVENRYMVNGSIHTHLLSFQFKIGQPSFVPKEGENITEKYDEYTYYEYSDLRINTQLSQYELYVTFDNYKMGYKNTDGLYYSVGIGGSYDVLKYFKFTMKGYDNSSPIPSQYIPVNSVPEESFWEFTYCVQATLSKAWRFGNSNKSGYNVYCTASYNGVSLWGLNGNISILGGVSYCMWGL